MNGKNLDRLESILSRSYRLAMQVQDGSPDPILAEELAGECGELLALFNGDMGSFGDEDCIDRELQELARELTSLGVKNHA
jgi:hypothetical protein